MTGPAGDLVYVVGAPAAGKSSLMAALTAACTRQPQTKPFAHDLLVRAGATVGVELGRQRPDFPGTDALSMSVSPAAKVWVQTRPARLILGEGDRLATRTFIGYAADAGYTVTVVHVVAPQPVLDARCAARGSQQNQPWRRGRATKAASLAGYAAANYRLVTVNSAAADPGALARLVTSTVEALEPLGEAACTSR